MKHGKGNCLRIIYLGLIMLSLVIAVISLHSASVFAEDSENNELKILYTDQFSYTDSNNVQWDCSGAIVQKDGKESLNAVVYGCNNAGPELVIPSKVRDKAGNILTVVGVVSANKVNSDYSGTEFRYNYDGESYISNIAEIYFPDSVYLIGDRVFASYFSAEDNDSFDNQSAAFALINKIRLPDNEDLIIGNMAFSHCGEYNGLGTSVVFGEKPVTIKSDAFWGCAGIESLTLPVGSKIAHNAFYDCLNIKEIINAPSGLSLGYCYKGQSPKLTKVSFAEGLTEIDGIDLKVVVNAESEEDDVEEYQYEYGMLETLKYITIPSSAKEIGGFDYTGVEKIQLPEGLETIREGAFAGCRNLTDINFPGSLKEIEDCAFKDCVNLHVDVNHPSKHLQYQYYNSGIRSITLRSDLELLYPGGLTKCPNLQSITIEESSDRKSGNFKTKDGVLYTGCYDYDGDFCGWLLGKYPAGRSSGSYTVPSDVIGLDGFAFEGCKFTEIHIPASCELELAQYMASMAEGFDGDDLIGFLPLDNMASKPVVYVIKGSEADGMYETCDKYTVRYEPGYEPPTPVQPVQPVQPVIPVQPVQPATPVVTTGTTEVVSGSTFKVVSANDKTVAFIKAKDVKNITIPATISINGEVFKVTQIDAGAFKGSKIRTVTIGQNVNVIRKNAFKGSKAAKLTLKTKLLKKAKIKGCLKGSKIKAIQVKVGPKSLNKKFVSIYGKLFTKANTGKKVTVK